MRRFIITSEKFKGQAEISYNEKGTLMHIDLTNSDMTEQHVIHFKQAVPANVYHLLEGKGFGSTTTIIEADFVVNFEMFWSFYDKKIKRHRSQPVWEKLSKTDQVKAYHGVKAYDKFLSNNPWRIKADPESYLRNRYWENEYK